jgi:hypothetical protein
VVHAGLAGIIQSLMFLTTFTKLNQVNLALYGGLFSFCNTRVNYSSLNLGGFDRDGGGNRYQSRLFILFLRGNSLGQTELNLVFSVFDHVPLYVLGFFR